MELAEIPKGNSLSTLAAAKQHLNDAQTIYNNWSESSRHRIDLDTKIAFFNAWLFLANHSLDAKEIAHVMMAVAHENLFAKDYWKNTGYVRFMKEHARSCYLIARLTGNGTVLEMARNNMLYLIAHVASPYELADSHDLLGAIDELFYFGFGVGQARREAVQEFQLASMAYRTIGNTIAANKMISYAKSIEAK